MQSAQDAHNVILHHILVSASCRTPPIFFEQPFVVERLKERWIFCFQLLKMGTQHISGIALRCSPFAFFVLFWQEYWQYHEFLMRSVERQIGQERLDINVAGSQ